MSIKAIRVALRYMAYTWVVLVFYMVCVSGVLYKAR